MAPDELVKRVRGVLRELRLLSEAPAVRYDTDRVRGGGSKSAPPPGTRFSRRSKRDLSLADFWMDRFRKADGDQRKVEYFLYLAERDLLAGKQRIEPRDPHETPSARAERVIRQYEGLSSLEAAVAEDCAEMWIRVTRMEGKRNPDDGWPESTDPDVMWK